MQQYIRIEWREFYQAEGTGYFLPMHRCIDYKLEEEAAATTFLGMLHFIGHHEAEVSLVDERGNLAGGIEV